MKHACLIFTLVSCLLLPSPSFADPGVVVDAKGSVKVAQGGKTITAKSGTQFADGATIEVAGGGSATLMFSSGTVKKLGGGEKYVAVKGASKAGGNTVIKGLAMAYNDAKKPSSGPTVHGMVKAAPGQKVAAKGDQTLTPERAGKLRADLKDIHLMGLSSDGKALMTAQVYYKYGQYQKMITELLPVYKSQSPPAEMIRNLLALGYDKLGKTDEAARYRK